jgi:chromosome segregation ATPase
MRKAFETNVPRLKPRLRSAPGAGQVELATAAPEAAAPAELAEAPPEPVAPPALVSRQPVVRARPVAREAKGEPVAAAPARPGDVVGRRDRLEKIKRKVAEAARPAPRLEPTPADPAQAAETVLLLVGELDAEVSRAREREEALRTDLDGARAELARAAGEARAGAERLALAEQELTEKRGVLTELLAEMEALEQERDEAVRRAQALSALDEERARILEEVTRRAEEEARLRADREGEVERLGEELRNSAADGARLRSAVGELARERDQLAGELDRIRAERDELASAKRALEQVHAALAQARAKLG